MNSTNQKTLKRTNAYLESAEMLLDLQKELIKNFVSTFTPEPIYQVCLTEDNWKDVTERHFQEAKKSGSYKYRILYAEPQQAKKFDLVRLTRSEINLLWDSVRHPEDFAKALEDKLAEKNL